jgi:hypothetical protein
MASAFSAVAKSTTLHVSPIAARKRIIIGPWDGATMSCILLRQWWQGNLSACRRRCHLRGWPKSATSGLMKMKKIATHGPTPPPRAASPPVPGQPSRPSHLYLLSKCVPNLLSCFRKFGFALCSFNLHVVPTWACSRRLRSTWAVRH